MQLFAYGTLMWPEVMQSVVGRRLLGVSARLSGYRRLRVKGEHYPVIIASLEDTVDGILYTDLSEHEFELLDQFEGEEYERVSVRIGNSEAQVYVLADGWWHIVNPCIWRAEDVRPEHLRSFCNEYKGWNSLKKHINQKI